MGPSRPDTFSAGSAHLKDGRAPCEAEGDVLPGDGAAVAEGPLRPHPAAEGVPVGRRPPVAATLARGPTGAGRVVAGEKSPGGGTNSGLSDSWILYKLNFSREGSDLKIGRVADRFHAQRMRSGWGRPWSV